MSAQTQPLWDAIWINGSLAVCESGINLLKDAAIATSKQKIAWIGPMRDLPAHPETLATRVYDLAGRCLTPGLIDCHTHFVYAGNRAHEFELRLQGVSYEEIARRGGGIQSTVTATRAASYDDLLQQSLTRARTFLANGVTTIEMKSGYGLDWPTELKMLQVAHHIETLLPLTIKKTFLGAHTLPIEYRQDADGYVDLICKHMIPEIAKQQLADAVDVFCEKIAFTLAQTETIFKTAMQYHLAIKCHAEQLSNMGGARLAARYHALSVDHLEFATEDDIRILSKQETVAVLLPGAYYFLRETTMPAINYLRQYAVPIAIASDCNPGTSPILSLLTILNMSATLFRLTPDEIFLGVTHHAAKALGLAKTQGSLAVGKMADFAIWNVVDPIELIYYVGNQPLWQLVKAGKLVE